MLSKFASPRRRLCCALFLAATSGLSQEAPVFSVLGGMSFEQGVPSHVSVSLGRLSTSGNRWAEGRKSLRWDFVPGDTLTIRGEIGYRPQPINPTNEADYFMPMGFNFPVYAGANHDTELRITFGRGDQADLETEVKLQHTGWEQFRLLYDRGHLRGQAHPEMDYCSLTILGDVSGTLYLDNLIFAQPMRASHEFPSRPSHPNLRFHPERGYNGGRERCSTHLNEPWLPLGDSVTKEEAASFREIESRYLELQTSANQTVDQHTQAAMEKVRGDFAELGMITEQGVVNGPVFAANEQSRVTPYAKMSKRLGTMYLQTLDPEQKVEIAEMGRVLITHAIQSKMPLDWYQGRGMADGMFMLRSALTQQGLLEDACRYVRDAYGFKRFYEPDEIFGWEGVAGQSSDTIYTDSIGILMSILMMPDSPEKVRDMRHFVQYYSEVMLGYAPGIRDSIKPDGSHFHHKVATLESYGYYTMDVVARMIRILAQTEFRVYADAHERIRNNFLIRGFYRGEKYFPMAYSQLNFPPDRVATPGEFAHLAYAGTPDGSELVDRLMASHFLRLIDRDSMRNLARDYVQEFEAMGIEPALTPNGHHTLSYYAKAIHRRSDWLAVVGGHSRYVYQMEHWPMPQNGERGARGGVAFCQFINTGMVEVIYPDLPARKMVNNGFEMDGWDWRRFPGTTAIDAPLSRIKTRVVRRGDEYVEHLFSDQSFVGGLASPDGQGIFTGTFRGHDKYGLQSMYATKSWFFFDDLIVCIGSGIRNQLPEYETSTTLFQNGLSTRDEPVYLSGGDSTTAFPFEKVATTTDLPYIIDNRGIGYYLPAGQNVVVHRQHQQSRSVKDVTDTAGDFTTAYLKHGHAPKNERYEYAMKIRTNAPEMAAFNQAMNADTPVYEVIQADESAHIVRHNPTQHLALVLFEKNNNLDLGPLAGVSHSSLVMMRPFGEAGDGYELSVSDPDLRFYEGHAFDVRRDLRRTEQVPYGEWWYGNDSIPSSVRITLYGLWDISPDSSEYARIIQHANGKTVISIRCQHGLTQSITLVAKH